MVNLARPAVRDEPPYRIDINTADEKPHSRIHATLYSAFCRL